MRRSFLLIACLAAPSTACFDSAEEPGEGVLAVNLMTGESREYDSEEDVPDGWVVCPDGGCPDPLACEELEEDACLSRADCEAIYAQSFAPECDAPEPCNGPFVGCAPAGGGDECDDVPVCELACPPGTRNPVDDRGCVRWCECEPEECGIEECGPQPLCPAVLCDDGSVAGCTGECARNADGVCAWEVISCPTPPEPEECSFEECGPQPLCPAVQCDDGSTAGCTGRCVRSDDGVCGWEVAECPAPPPTDECTDEECGPAPECAAIVCEDGSLGGCTGRCYRHDDGTCGWEIRECVPEPCPLVPQCELACPPGTHNPVDDDGCEHTCECVPDADAR